MTTYINNLKVQYNHKPKTISIQSSIFLNKRVAYNQESLEYVVSNIKANRNHYDTHSAYTRNLDTMTKLLAQLKHLKNR